MKFINAVIGYLFVFLVVDAAWINLIALDLYQANISDIMIDKPRMLPALGFYLGFAGIAVYLIAAPAKSTGECLLNGALLGGLAYGTFSFSNYALLTSWEPILVITDTIFGAVVTALCSWVAHLILTRSR